MNKKEERIRKDEENGVKNIIKVLESGDINKLSKNGYKFLTKLPDFIAHNEQAAFMLYYSDLRDLMEDLEYGLTEADRVARRDNDKERLKLLEKIGSFIKKTDMTKLVQKEKEKSIKNLEAQIAVLQEKIEQEKLNKRISKRAKRAEFLFRSEMAYESAEANWRYKQKEKEEKKKRLKA